MHAGVLGVVHEVGDRVEPSRRAGVAARRAVERRRGLGRCVGDLVAGLIRAGGYEPVRVGGLDQSIRIEMFGDLHEFGGLGRVVTKEEALKVI